MNPASNVPRDIGKAALRSNSRPVEDVLTSTVNLAVGGGDRSGDWCETIPLSRARIAVSIGDVCGHGEPAFGTMTAMRNAVHEAAERDCDPMQTLAEANLRLCETAPTELATAIFGIVDPESDTFTYASAGHPAPLIVGASGPDFLTIPEAELPLGLDPTLEPALHRIAIPPETLLVLYTDGVTEHKRDLIEGEAELRAAAVDAYQSQDIPVATAIADRMNLAEPKHDDAAILTAWLRPNGRRVKRGSTER